MAIILTLRFILEICALVSLSYWGFQSGQGILMKLGLGIGAPLLIAIIWGMFGSPKAPVPLQGFHRFLLELLIFGLAIVALYSLGKSTLAIIYAVVAVINLILMSIWNQ